jgi:hypothetical protein
MLALSDDQGKIWWAERQPDGATFALASISLAEALDRLRTAHETQQLRLPQDFDPQGRSDALAFGRQIYRWQSMQVDQGQPTPTASTSILERSLRAAIADDQTPLLRPGAYLAVVEKPPEVPYGVERFEQVETFHLISGRWLP